MNLNIEFITWKHNGTRYAMLVNGKKHELDECGDAGYYYTSSDNAKVTAKYILKRDYNIDIDTCNIRFKNKY